MGRVFNGLATAYDFKQQGDDVTVRFQGTGARWVGELSKADHPADDLFEAVKDTVAGVSCGCADVFGATEAVEQSGFDLIKDNLCLLTVNRTGVVPPKLLFTLFEDFMNGTAIVNV